MFIVSLGVTIERQRYVSRNFFDDILLFSPLPRKVKRLSSERCHVAPKCRPARAR